MFANIFAKAGFFVAIALASGLVMPGPSQASELVMFEQGGCVWCAKWNREVAPVYEKTTEAKILPLRRIDIGQQNAAGVTLKEPVRYTPTFVVVDNGREVGRITGYINDESFWGLLDTLAAKLEAVPLPRI